MPDAPGSSATQGQHMKDLAAKALTDYNERGQTQTTDLDNVRDKPRHISRGMDTGLSVGYGCLIAIGLDQGGSGCTEDEMAMINQPVLHVGQAIRNAKAVTQLRDTLFMLNQTLEVLREGLSSVTPEERILWDTPEAQRLLDAYGLRLDGRLKWLPSRLRAWMNRELSERNHQMDGFALCKPLVVERGESTLLVRLRSKGRNIFLLPEESRAGYVAQDLALLGLSPRKTEILVWVAQGKTNPEIGMILGISPRTVQKHLKRVYSRLGVENRHAAMVIVSEAMDRGHHHHV